jgi:hypothetical protein
MPGRRRQDVWIRIDTMRGIIEENADTNDIRSCAGRSLAAALEALPMAGLNRPAMCSN